MASQLNVALIHKLRGSLMCLAYFFAWYPCLYNQEMSHVWSIGAGNKLCSIYCLGNWYIEAILFKYSNWTIIIRQTVTIQKDSIQEVKF